jgi:hypothetical protein
VGAIASTAISAHSKAWRQSFSSRHERNVCSAKGHAARGREPNSSSRRKEALTAFARKE